MIENYPLYWPENWPRTPKWKRQSSLFRKTTGVVRDFLENEIWRLGGNNLIVSTNMPTRLDGRFYASAKDPDDTGVAVYFTYKKKTMCFACDKHPTVRENLHAIAMTINALRGIERWGASDMMERAFRGFAALPAGGWRLILGVDPGVSLDQVESRFRELAHQFHPDKGGDPEKFRAIVNARDEARKELEAQ